MGARTNAERDLHMATLLDDGFEQSGVPVTRHAPARFREPSLVASADAAAVPAPALHLAAFHARGRHGVQLRLVRGGTLRGSILHDGVHRVAATTPIHATLAIAHVKPGTLGTRRVMADKGVAACSVRPGRHGCTFHTRDKRKT